MIEKKIFQATKSGLFTAGRERKMTELVTQQAQDWINDQSDIRTLDISLSMGQGSAIAVVWLEKPES
jgi:hypothetical protein